MEYCSLDPYLSNETRIYISGHVESRYQDEYGMYCGFYKHVLMCAAYTNLANTFRISFLSKNSDLSSMLEA